MKNQFLLLITFFLSINAFGQDDLLEMLMEDEESKPKKIAYTFKAIKLINANTIETTKKNTLDFRITHRFGDMKIGEPQGKHTLWGLDNATNIRFSFDYGLTDKISLGIGRSKTQEHIDGNLKFRFIEQKEKGIPLSIAYFTNIALSPIANIPGDKFENRLSYTHQLIFASKASRWLSLELLPTLIHRNYVYSVITNPENGAIDEHDLFSLGFAGRFKLTNRFALVVDYFLTFSDFRTSANNYYNPLGIGIEVETGGHVFHVNLTNSSGIIENDYIPQTTGSWDNGEYKLGFNISRVFTL